MAGKSAKNVDEYIKNKKEWKAEIEKLREILLSCSLEECVKWGAPCYMHEGKNLVAINGFKSYVGLWFYNAGELPDPDGVLQTAEKSKSDSMKQWRFESAKEMKKTKIKAYIKSAKECAKKPKAKKKAIKFEIPPELEEAFAKSKKLLTSFEALTPGKQRDYAEYISEAKREATKESRLQKIIPMIKAGSGLNDKYC